MSTRHTIAAIAVAAAALGVGGVATAEAPPTNPSQLCSNTDNFDGYLASHGGCTSSVASIGVDALMEFAFPSRAAAIANCKGIADMVGGFPYSFYGRVDDSRYLATNLNTCVGILFALHTGQLQPGPG